MIIMILILKENQELNNSYSEDETFQTNFCNDRRNYQPKQSYTNYTNLESYATLKNWSILIR